MSKCKTERECVKEVLRLAKAEGYEDIEEIIKNNKQLKPGDKVLQITKEKLLRCLL